jgi:hypothetical protein
MIATKDPRFPLLGAGEIARFAHEGMIVEWDMKTLVGNSLRDLTGQGNHALFNAAPTVTAQGISFNGTYWADALIQPALKNEFSFFLVSKVPGDGYIAFGNRNATTQQGHSLRMLPNMQLNGQSDFNDCAGPVSNGNVWTAVIVKVDAEGHARIKSLTGGILGYTHILRADGDDLRTLWRIGAGIGNLNGTDSAYLPLASGVLAYAGIFNRMTSEDQDAALLSLLRASLTPRGIAL